MDKKIWQLCIPVLDVRELVFRAARGLCEWRLCKSPVGSPERRPETALQLSSQCFLRKAKLFYFFRPFSWTCSGIFNRGGQEQSKHRTARPCHRGDCHLSSWAVGPPHTLGSHLGQHPQAAPWDLLVLVDKIPTARTTWFLTYMRTWWNKRLDMCDHTWMTAGSDSWQMSLKEAESLYMDATRTTVL